MLPWCSPMAALPLNDSGATAATNAVGRWLMSAEDLCATSDTTAATVAGGDERDALRLCFPRNWPACFKESAPLKRLLNKSLQGKRVRVVAPNPSAKKTLAVAFPEVALHPLHSFANAERIEGALSWPCVKGFAVFEMEGAEPGTEFVAWKHWWNALPNGTWVDLTPRGDGGRPAPTLLIECSRGEKAAEAMRPEGLAFATRLARRLRAARTQPRETFVPAATFAGARPGWVYKTGPEGAGYYFEGTGKEAEDEEDGEEQEEEEGKTGGGGGGEGEEDNSGGGAVAMSSLSTCSRCDGCRSPAAPHSAEEAASSARAQGSAALKAADPVVAAALFLEACRRSPAAHTHYSNLSLALCKANAPRHAATAARRCVALCPTFSKGHYRLGQALKASGACMAAAAALREAVRHAPSEADAAEARAELAKVEAEATSHFTSHAEEDEAVTGWVPRGTSDDLDAEIEDIGTYLHRRDAEAKRRALAIAGGLRTCADCGYAACVACQADEARSTCRCPASNFGDAYCDSTGPRARMGTPGGKRYTGPFKCAAQMCVLEPHPPRSVALTCICRPPHMHAPAARAC